MRAHVSATWNEDRERDTVKTIQHRKCRRNIRKDAHMET